jgi:hypothetical protein
MAERVNIPSSPACGQWEILLADALDGQLKPSDEPVFAAHMAVCPACSALFEEARRGREWLEFLAPEPEMPAGLLDKILSQTGPGHLEAFGMPVGGGNALPVPAGFTPASTQAWQRPGLVGHVRRFAEPRLLMTAAMAFFSISVTLAVTNVRLSSLRLAEQGPTSLPNSVRSFVERRLTMASTPIIRYYDHHIDKRFVYEVESELRELRRGTPNEGGVGGGSDRRRKPKDTSPGESRQNPVYKDGGSRVDPPLQAGNQAPALDLGPARDDSNEFLEASLTFTSPNLLVMPAHSGGSAIAVRKRSKVWTA